MLAFEIVSIVVVSLLVWAIGCAVVLNYCKNHFEKWDGWKAEESRAGAVTLAAFWPLTIWGVIIWAFATKPKDRARCDPLLYHLLSPQGWAMQPRALRREIRRREAINRAEMKAGQPVTQWQLPPYESAMIRNKINS